MMADINDLINAGVWFIDPERFKVFSNANHPSEVDSLGHVDFGNASIEFTGRMFLVDENGISDKFVIDYDEYVPISEEYKDDSISLRTKEISVIPPDNRLENNIDIPAYELQGGGFIERTSENILSIENFKKAVAEKLLKDNIISLDYVADYQHLKDTNKGFFQRLDKARDYEFVNEKKFIPKTFVELKKLVNDETIHLGDIDVSNIQDMSELFFDSERKDFSGIDTWDVSHVTDMSYMFYGTFMDEPIGKWDVSNVKDMSNMFAFSTFDQPIADWQVSNVENMNRMFMDSKFNQPLGKWDVSHVENMSEMFVNAPFNQPIDTWDVSNVKYMGNMFCGSDFNQPIDSWNIESVVNMNNMFRESKFNQHIPSWKIDDYKELGFYSDGLIKPTSFKEGIKKIADEHIKAGESLPEN